MSEFTKWESKYPDSWFSCVPGENGFLPVRKPLEKLPEQYNIVNEILENMKLNKENGYLKLGTLYETITKLLPIFDFSYIQDKQLCAALHRDYCFLASAYSFEPCHLSLMNSEEKKYGKARSSIPSQIALPLKILSKKNDVFPWLDYAYGYGLNNAILKDGCDPKKHESYKTIRTFNGHDSEEGFINVHVAMVSQSGQLLKYQQECLQNIYEDNRQMFNAHLQSHYETFQSIINTLQTMWKASNYEEYLSFRTFIMGQIGNKECYPNEKIIFEGDNFTVPNYETHSYRGETGAQDSIIPSVDSFLQLSYPRNELTEYLYDLRKYRPKDHEAYIQFMKENSEKLEFKKYCLQSVNSCILLLKNLNCLRMFRKKHWNLTKKYIIENTKHPVATGGTPITTWLPNQLGATLEYMDEIIKHVANNIKDIHINDLEFFNTIQTEISDHIQSIMDEVRSLQHDFKEQKHDDFMNRSSV